MAIDLRPQLDGALDNALDYPRNLLCSNELDHSLDALRHQLGERSQKLFCREPDNLEESKTRVDIWELYGDNDGFIQDRPRNTAELKFVLRKPIGAGRCDPKQRIICVQAPHSKAKLGISQRMFLQILSYHNVMPAFLEYVFPFGLQHYQRDFHLMGFRNESRFSNSATGLAIPQLGRHGRHVELCYSLKSVEMDDRAPPLGWSIRQCSLHHFYDLKSEQSTWIIVKANYVISDAVVKQAKDGQKARSSSTDRQPSVLASNLDIHNVLAAWAGQNWTWYINKLEAYLQDASRSALSASWELPTRPIAETDLEEKEIKPITSEKKSWTWKSLHKRDLSGATLQGDEKSEPFRSPTRSNTFDTIKSEVGLPTHHTTGFDDFSFRDLQSVQFVEERANEVLLILKSNSNVLKDLVNHYRTLSQSSSCLKGIPMDFASAFSQFEQRVTSIEKDIQLQITRVQTLLSFTADRKSLLNAVFQYRSMQASRLYAAKAQLSAERMEDMTAQMGIIAKKTEAETVAMRIITIVTLFFLPGTFMAALFSTPIVNFDNGVPDGSTFSWANVGVGALKLYAIASLPLVLMTFVAWGMMRWWERRKERKRIEKERVDKQNMA